MLVKPQMPTGLLITVLSTCLLLAAEMPCAAAEPPTPRAREILAPRTKQGRPPFTAIAYSPDGTRLLTGHLTPFIGLWDAESGKLVQQLAGSDDEATGAVAFSPDGKVLATAGNARVIHLWDAKTGKELRKLAVPSEWVLSLAFSPDGKWFVSGDTDNRIRLWQVDTGAALAEFSGHTNYVHWADFSAKGDAILSAGHDGTIRVWDVKTRKEIRRVDGVDPNGHAALSPDKRLLAYATCTAGELRHDLHIWDVAEWRELHSISILGDRTSRLAFSTDGAILAEYGNGCEVLPADDLWLFSVALWEVRTGRLIGRLKHGDITTHPILSGLSFSPDGRHLAWCHFKPEALLWDLSRWPAPKGKPGAIPPVRRLWDDLASPDATEAHRAVWEGVASPAESLKELKRHLRPVAAAKVEAIPGLIRQLDSDEFQDREQATQELEKMGSCAETALRRAANESPSAEVKRRAEDLLNKLDRSEGRLCEARVIPLLERIGTAEATQFLEELAKGAPEASLTREAKAALERLRIRSRTGGRGASTP